MRPDEAPCPRGHANNPASGHAGYDGFGDACDGNISGDGYTNAQHSGLGKDPTVYCPIMRADVSGNGTADLADLVILSGYYNRHFAHDGHPLKGVDAGIQRADQNGDNYISLADLIIVQGDYLQHVTACP